jgi:hypothetical protein
MLHGVTELQVVPDPLGAAHNDGVTASADGARTSDTPDVTDVANTTVANAAPNPARDRFHCIGRNYERETTMSSGPPRTSRGRLRDKR